MYVKVNDFSGFYGIRKMSTALLFLFFKPQMIKPIKHRIIWPKEQAFIANHEAAVLVIIR